MRAFDCWIMAVCLNRTPGTSSSPNEHVSYGSLQGLALLGEVQEVVHATW